MIGWFKFFATKKYCFETGVNWKKARNYAKSTSSVDKNFCAITQDLGLDKSGAMSSQKFPGMADNIIFVKAEKGFEKENKTGNKTWNYCIIVWYLSKLVRLWVASQFIRFKERHLRLLFLHLADSDSLSQCIVNHNLFAMQMCNKQNKGIFCFENKCAFSWHIKINRWRQREYSYKKGPFQSRDQQLRKLFGKGKLFT